MVLNTFRHDDSDDDDYNDDDDDEMITIVKFVVSNETIFPQTLILNTERLRFRMKYSRIFDI